jgi:uncharacterized protein YndB with AHSA1/START domain
MIKFDKSIIINRPVEEVWKFISNVENIPKWNRGTRKGRVTSDGSVGVGSTVQYLRQFLGRQMLVKLSVSEYIPNKMIVLKLSARRITAQTGFTFGSVEGGPRLTHPSEMELGGLWKLITSILNPMLERDGLEDMANIKRLIEFPS